MGALVAEHWRFPQAIVEAIGCHHTPPARAMAFALVRIVHVADQLARVLERGAEGGGAPPAAWIELG